MPTPILRVCRQRYIQALSFFYKDRVHVVLSTTDLHSFARAVFPTIGLKSASLMKYLIVMPAY